MPLIASEVLAMRTLCNSGRTCAPAPPRYRYLLATASLGLNVAVAASFLWGLTAAPDLI